jgi:hypothetical protein
LNELKSSNYHIDEETAIQHLHQRQKISNPDSTTEQEVASAKLPESAD